MFAWLPQSEQDKLDALTRRYGDRALTRVRALFEDRPTRLPFQTAERIVPGLSTTPWLDVDGALGALAASLENSFPTISRELKAALPNVTLAPYNNARTKISGWKTLHLFNNGVLDRKVASLFPSTLDALSPHQDCLYGLGEVFFSVLEPGAKILPHSDPGNFWVPLHLGIVVPAGCDICVANETRCWGEGRSLVFDASFEHHARNEGAEPRIVLLAEVWHPNLTLAERNAIEIVFRYLMAAFRRE